MSAPCITLLAMRLTGTESVYDDLWSTAIYDHTTGQYTVTYRVDVQEGFVAEVWKHIPVDTLVITDQFFDVDLDREVVIMERQASAQA